MLLKLSVFNLSLAPKLTFFFAYAVSCGPIVYRSTIPSKQSSHRQTSSPNTDEPMLLLDSIESVRMSRDPPGPGPGPTPPPLLPLLLLRLMACCCCCEAASIFFASNASINERGRDDDDEPDRKDIFSFGLLRLIGEPISIIVRNFCCVRGFSFLLSWSYNRCQLIAVVGIIVTDARPI